MSRSAEDMAKLWRLLADIEAGAVMLTRVGEEEFHGNNEYHGSDGSRLVVFCDGGQWDYLDRVVLADGTVFDYDDCPAYYPPADKVQALYGDWFWVA